VELFLDNVELWNEQDEGLVLKAVEYLLLGKMCLPLRIRCQPGCLDDV